MNKLIEDLSASGALAGTTLFETQVPGVTPTQKSTLAQLNTFLGGSFLPIAGGTLTGNLLFTDNTLDIGASGATRPRTGYFGTSVVTPLVTILANANANALTVTGYSLTGANAQSMFDLAGTWNTSGTPTALKLNITNTASNAASKYLEFMLDSLYSMFKVDIGGICYANGFRTTAGQMGIGMGVVPLAYNAINSAGDIVLAPFAGGGAFLQLRTGTNATVAQFFRTTDAGVTNYERLALQSGAGYFEIAAETAGTGTDNIDLRLTPAGTGNVTLPGGAVLLKTTGALTDGAGIGAGTITTAPTAGNPTKWLAINDAGTIRYVPAW